MVSYDCNHNKGQRIRIGCCADCSCEFSEDDKSFRCDNCWDSICEKCVTVTDEGNICIRCINERLELDKK